VARDRKRAKQRRRERRGTTAGGRVEHTVAPGLPVRADLPGSLDHASSEVDEFDAALVAGAGGVPAPPEVDVDEPEAAVEAPEIELDEPQSDSGVAVAERGSGGGRGNGAGGGGRGGDGGGEGESGQPSAPGVRGPGRAFAFLRASWAELQRVQWPDRRQVTQATAVVLGFVAIAGLYLGLADFVAKEIVEYIL
jgi:preprotein translocase SecE subunit